MSKKLCKGCGLKLSLTCFYKNNGMRDGRLNYCKSCDDKAHRKHHLKMRKESPEWVKKRRQQARDRTKRWLIRHGIKNSGSDKAKADWKLKNPTKIKAHTTARTALLNGVLVKPKTCNRCGHSESRLEMHHEDYSKPLAIEWLCPACHGVTKRKPIL